MGITAAIGAAILHETGGAETWAGSAYLVYEMLMGEFPEFPKHPASQVVTALMPILGILFVAEGVIKLGFSAFRKEENKGAWMSILAGTARNHVILCGLGTVGYRVLEELLLLGTEVFVIERNPEGAFVPLARARGVDVLIADARAENQLRTMNVLHARAIIIATNDDLANLEIAMDVREISATIPIVLRLFDQRLADKVGNVIGIEMSVSTSKLAAPLFASCALDKRVVGTHRLGTTLLVVLELHPTPASPIVGKTLHSLSDQHHVTFVAVQDGAGWHPNPAPDWTVAAGTSIQVMLPGNRVRETADWG